ncbi:MAG: LysM peptidoglycan-binding domain-containing protein [Planctomycetota bacterium]
MVSGIRSTIDFLKRLRLPFEIDFRSPLGPDGGEFTSPLLSRSFESATQLAVALEIRQILASLWPTIGSGTESEKLDELRGRVVSEGARSVIDQLQQVYEAGADAGTSSDDLRTAVIAIAQTIGADVSTFPTTFNPSGAPTNAPALPPVSTRGTTSSVPASSPRPQPQPASPPTYTVQRGDNLTTIAQNYPGVSAMDLYTNNPTVLGKPNGSGNPNLIFPGQVLAIPQLPAPSRGGGTRNVR